MPTRFQFYTIIDMDKYKRNLQAGIDNKAINNNTMVDLASVYEGTANDNMDVISGTIDDTNSGSQVLQEGFYRRATATNGTHVFYNLGLRGQEPGSVIDDAGDKEKFSTTALNEMKAGISLNNETGFKVNRGQGADYEDFGKDCIMNINKKGKVTTQHTKELYVQTGSMVANVRPATGGGGGAGGGSQYGQSGWDGWYPRRNGGDGGQGGKTVDKIIIFPKTAGVFKIKKLIGDDTGFGEGGLGGNGGEKSSYKAQAGGAGEDSQPSKFTIIDESDDDIYSLTTSISGGGGGGGRGATANTSNGANGASGSDVTILTPYSRLDHFKYTIPDSEIKSFYASGGQEKGGGDGEAGENGTDAKSDILIHLIGSCGLHRNIPT